MSDIHKNILANLTNTNLLHEYLLQSDELNKKEKQDIGYFIEENLNIRTDQFSTDLCEGDLDKIINTYYKIQKLAVFDTLLSCGIDIDNYITYLADYPIKHCINPLNKEYNKDKLLKEMNNFIELYKKKVSSTGKKPSKRKNRNRTKNPRKK